MTTERVKDIIAGICSSLEYDDAYHRYTLDDFVLTPVTNQVASYKVPFRKWDIAKAMANKFTKQAELRGTPPVTAAEIVAQWDKEREAAAAKGTKVHHFIEPYPQLTREPDCPEEIGALNWLKQLPPYYKPVATEKRVYSESRKLGGTMDKLFYNEEKGTLALFDWKTNKDIHKNHKGQKLKPPYEDLLDCPLNHYKIQLNLYKLCLEEHTDYHKLYVDEMAVIWLHPDLPEYFAVYPVEPLVLAC